VIVYVRHVSKMSKIEGDVILALGENNGGTVSGAEVSQAESNALQTWNPGVSSYGSFTGALPTTGTVYEGGISYYQFPLPSGQTCP
jgi:hypothetical protein